MPTGPAVGTLPQAKFATKEIQLLPGEIMFAYTDGVIDARSAGGERFGKERLLSLLSRPAGNAADLMQRIGIGLFAHIGIAPQEDDITMLTVQRKDSDMSD